MSEYLTEGLDEYNKNGITSHLILREFVPEFHHKEKQYRVFVKEGIVVGICQKHANHIEEEPTVEMVKKII